MDIGFLFDGKGVVFHKDSYISSSTRCMNVNIVGDIYAGWKMVKTVPIGLNAVSDVMNKSWDNLNFITGIT